MKTLKFILGLLLLPFCLAHAGCPSAKKNFVEGGFRYIIFDDTTDVRISDAADTIPLPITADSTLVIPSSVMHEGRRYHVTGIRRYTFLCRPEVKHLVISEGVEMIEDRIFTACYNLESVQFPSTMDYMGEYLFYDCPRLSRLSVAKGNEQFDSRKGCNAVINKDGDYVQLGCKGTVIPHGVDSIGNMAFSGCTGMESITIPEGIKAIGYDAFHGCYQLRSVRFPNSLRSLGTGCFSACLSLDSVFIPKGIRKVKGNVFSGCSQLKSIVVDEKNRYYDSRNHCNAIVETATNNMIAACVTSTIPHSIDSIGYGAFGETQITSINIPSNIKRIKGGAFRGCTMLSSIEVEAGNPVYDSHDHCNAVIETATNSLIVGCGRTVVPHDVSVIGAGAFEKIPLSAVLSIPEGIERIEGMAFGGCMNIEMVILPRSLRKLACNAFFLCKNLSLVRILSHNLVSSGFAFSDCNSLKYVELPLDLSGIDENTFYECI